MLIADDDPFVREGVERLLASTPSCRVRSRAATSEEILAQLEDVEVEALLLDIHLPGPGAIEVLREVKQRRPELPVLIFSVDLEESQALELLDRGADGFVAKKDAPTELAGALEGVARGHRYVSSSMAKRLMDRSTSRPRHGLSERELQVLRQLAEGRRIRDIAMELHVSPKTISTYRARVLEKTGLRTNADLVRFALRNRLTT